jgi:hypothetical protein
MKTTLPERSLELWTAGYLVHALPDITLWAPTQRATSNFDMSAGANGKLFLFEFKAAYLGAGEHVVKIDLAQLARYLSHPVMKACTYYLLPLPPYATTAAIGGYLPDVARARQGNSLMGWPPVECWAWAVPATTLGSVLGGSSGTRQVACRQIPNQFGPSALPLAQLSPRCRTAPQVFEWKVGRSKAFPLTISGPGPRVSASELRLQAWPGLFHSRPEPAAISAATKLVPHRHADREDWLAWMRAVRVGSGSSLQARNCPIPF